MRFRVPLPGTVLPKVLRRPARLLSRVDIAVPPRFGLKAAVAFLAVVAIYGVVIGGHVESTLGGLTAAAGLKIAAIQISGQSETAERDILDRLAIPDHRSIVLFDAEAARQRVEQLDWVASASIRKVYPATLVVEVVERTPYAIWQHDRQFSLIDQEGHVIGDYIAARYSGLPQVVGAGAAELAAPLLTILGEFPSLKAEIQSATLVGGRRWNLTLHNGITILLPEGGDLVPAIVQLVGLDQRHQLLARDIVSIDLRLADRMVIQLSEGVLEEVETEVAAARRNGGN
jgi:cell division protein FtsQ